MGRPRLGVLVVVCFVAAHATSGCGKTRYVVDRVPDLDEGCLDAGTCECTRNVHCTDPNESVCVNGACEPSFVYVDAGLPDGALDPDGGLVGDGCGFRDPEFEQCNGRDDDCDGTADENFVGADDAFSTTAHCGGCGIACDELLSNLRTGPGGEPVSGATTCALHADGFTCEPVLCADGFAPFVNAEGEAVVCLPRVAASCQPCASASDCGTGVGHVCEPVGAEGNRCLQYCDAASGDPACDGTTGEQGCCPNGFTCAARGARALCEPEAGSCQCTPGTTGLMRVCSSTSSADATICLGVETCEATPGGGAAWSGCVTSSTTDVCDETDNDCDGEIDDGYATSGQYLSDTACGTCGNDCTTRFTAAVHHAVGVCDASAGPDCVIASCTSTSVGGGLPCRDDAGCASLPGTTCDATFGQCVRACASDAGCGGGVCRAGTCTTTCANDAACQGSYGASSRCVSGACMTAYAWNDFDGLELNGCECPGIVDGIDEPDTFPAYPAAESIVTLDRDCDGVDGNVERALFVRAGAAGGDGTRAAPFGTINQALAAWNPASHDHVLVATGTYTERVVLTSGVRLYGGYSADFSIHNVALYPTELTAPAPAPGAALAASGVLYASGITTTTIVAGVTVRGYDVPAGPAYAGTSSYAIITSNSSDALVFVNVHALGGRGGDGASGAEGVIGARGNDGGNGSNARECASTNCSGESSNGGTAGTNPSCATALACPGMESDSGNPQTANAPPAGCTYANGGGQASYNGGGAEYCKYDLNPPALRNGPTGVDGATGANGTGGAACTNGFGTIVGGVWTPAVAGVGTQGAPGTGGAGGSAGSWVQNNKAAGCTILNRVGDLGGAGGGGGAGGCGGGVGARGNTGGASFAFYVVSASGARPTITASLVTRGRGGNGGGGGAGGAGGAGGNPGLGGTVDAISWGAGPGGNGGSGGYGGDGGGGGGGCGGPAFGIAGPGIPTTQYANANTFTIPNVTSTGGLGGLGGYGPGGTGGAQGSDGTNGASANVHAY